MPERIQRKRSKGWRMPEGVVYVGRPTVWGNPYAVIPGRRDAAEAVHRFAVWFAELPDWRRHTYSIRAQIELAGRDLACWCPLDEPCHADVLLEIANPVVPKEEKP